MLLTSPSASPNAERDSLFVKVDILIITLLVLLLSGILAFHFALTVGDWDYWIDWRDRRWWPLVTPLSLTVFPAVFSVLAWKKFRLPVVGTLIMVAFAGSSWMSRVVNFEMFAGFPLNMVAPSTFIALGLIIDTVLVITGSLFFTGIIAGFLVGLLIYPLNWPLMAPYHQPVESMGALATVADMIGYQYIRTAMPEYLRIIEESTLRTFGEAVTPLTAVFAGFLNVLNFWFWMWIGHLACRQTWINKPI